MKKVNTQIVDAVMGTGKTNKIIEQIRTSKHPVLILVERQSEVDRIKDALGADIVSVREEFEDEDTEHSSCSGALEVLADTGKHLVSTHQLMRYWSDRFLRSVKVQGYELIIDEALTGILQVDEVPHSDISLFLESDSLRIKENSKPERIVAGLQDEDGHCLPTKYRQLERRVRNKTVYLYTQRNDAGKPHYRLIETLRLDIWDSFRKIWVLTYKFSGSLLKYYLDLHKIEFETISIVEDEYADYIDPQGHKYRDLIKIYNGRYNDFDRYETDRRAVRDGLTVSWSERKQGGRARREKTRRNIRNYFQTAKRTNGATLETFAWTYHKKFLNDVYSNELGSKKNTYAYWDTNKRKGLTEKECRAVTWLPQNLRGTNDFMHKTHMAYCSNTYMDGTLKRFLSNNGVSVDEETFALNQMIQWLWRGCIRNGEPMDVYIPSRRMRNMLEKWLGYSQDELTKYNH